MGDMVTEVTTSVLLNPVELDISVMTRRSNSATSTPRRTLARSPSRLARKFWTPSTLRSVRRESIHIVRKHMREVIIALVLLIITLILLLLLLILDIMRVMVVVIITRNFRICCCFRNQ